MVPFNYHSWLKSSILGISLSSWRFSERFQAIAGGKLGGCGCGRPETLRPTTAPPVDVTCGVSQLRVAT